IFIFFFFQAEDGIRDLIVTGVKTCALPISAAPGRGSSGPWRRLTEKHSPYVPYDRTIIGRLWGSNQPIRPPARPDPFPRRCCREIGRASCRERVVVREVVGVVERKEIKCVR